MDRRWLGIEVRHLAALEAIEVERSFRRAAERLGYGQAAVSQQLSSLERLVGARLVDRKRGQSRVQLTHEGTVLLDYAERILDTLRAARADLDGGDRSHGKTVRLGAFPAAAARILPPMLARLAMMDTQVHVEVKEALSDGDLFDAVASGSLDCAFAELPLRDGPFESVALMTDPCVLVLQEGSSLTQQDTPPTLEDIARLPLAYPTWRMGNLIQEHFRAAGLDPARIFALQSDSAAQALARTGLAAAIMPLLAVDPDVVGTTTVDLTHILPPRKLVLYWHRERAHGAGLTAVIRVARVICEQLADRAQPRTQPNRPTSLTQPVTGKASAI
jgi:LysR family transcriptional regulator, hydrogen peroxide-inducible genes activator